MIQIRNNVFETNSSSTHSICIAKKPVDADGCHVDFYIGEFGWSYDEVDPGDYLYTSILMFDDWKELLGKLKDILDCHTISYTFERPIFDEDGWLENGCVDHGGETREFIEAVLNDEDMLMRLLFGNSVVYTGNDNESMEDKCYSAEPTIWVYDSWSDYDGKQIPNPNHDEEKYDYFFKGN